MNIGIYIINSKDKNAECRVGNTKIQLHRLKKKKKTSLFTGFYNNIQRPIKREIKKRQREVKRESVRTQEERKREKETRGHKSRAVERTREVKESNK